MKQPRHRFFRLPFFILIAAGMELSFFGLLFVTFGFSAFPVPGGAEVSVEFAGFDAVGETHSPPLRVRGGTPPLVGGDVPKGQRGRVGGRYEEQGVGSGEKGSDPVLAEIRSRIERVKHYPLLAQKSGLEGVVALRFKIDQQGRLLSPEIIESSGSPLLDEAAMVSVKKAVPFPRYDKPISLMIRYQRGS